MTILVRKLLGLVFPIKCLGCGAYGEYVCGSCLEEVKSLDRQQCPHCRGVSELGEFCSGRCRDGLFGYPAYFDGLYVCSEYDRAGVLKKLITQFKYKFSEEIVYSLSSKMSEQRAFMNKFCDQGLGNEKILIVPVPLHYKRQKERGFNQAYLLAKQMEWLLRPNSKLTNALVRNKNTKKQSKLSRADRLNNLTGAFSLKQKQQIDGRQVILIDDVCTTGSTLNECAKVLKKAGAKSVRGFVLARGTAPKKNSLPIHTFCI
jgi:competence protein ComFC